MKKLPLFLLSFMFSLCMLGQVPSYIPYQAIARDASGQIKANSAVQVQFKIFNTMIASTAAYSELHSVSTNDFGYFNLRIGGGTVQSGSFAAITWQTGDVSYEVWADMGAGLNQIGGRSGFLSVPYALYAGNASVTPTLSINSPHTVTNPSAGVYSLNVASPTLSVNGSTLSISDGNTVILPVTSYTAGAGLSISGSTITNTAPDQTVTISGSGVSGSYPSFTIASTAATSVTAGNSNIIVSGTSPNYTIASTPTLALTGNQLSVSNGNTVTIPSASISAGSNISVSGSSNNYTIDAVTPTLTTTGNATISGAYPTQTISVAPESITQGANILVSGAAPNYTIDAVTPTLSASGNASVSGSYPTQTISVASQTLGLAGNTLSLSGGGGSVNLPLTNITQGSNIIVNGASPNYTINAITPTLNASGNATVSGAYPTQTISVASQTLSASGNTISLSGGGGTVTVNGWTTSGNAGTSLPGNFIGTTDANGFAIRTNNSERMRITPTGSIGIGTTAPFANFDINAGTVKLGAGSDNFSTIKYGTISTTVLLSLGSNAGTVSIPGAQTGDAVVVTLNNHTAGAGSISLNNAYISSSNTLSYNVSTSLGLLVTLNFSYILMRP